MAGRLEDHSDYVDDAASDNRRATTNYISTVTSNDCTEESASGQDGDDERVVSTCKQFGRGTFDDVDEDCRTSDTVDVSRVITEEDATERGEGAYQVGLPGDRRLDMVEIMGDSEGAGASRHDGRRCCGGRRRGKQMASKEGLQGNKRD